MRWGLGAAGGSIDCLHPLGIEQQKKDQRDQNSKKKIYKTKKRKEKRALFFLWSLLCQECHANANAITSVAA
jgi:hypothetical protein